MEATNFNRANRWKKRPSHRSSLLPISLLALTLCILLIVSYRHISTSLIPISRSYSLPCSLVRQTLGEKFLWYAPHSGFSNQLSEFKSAILMAAILNRTLVVPPILDHHAVALGSCPKFRVLNPRVLRMSVWNHIVDLIRTQRYVSMTDVVDVSSLVSATGVRFIDFRVFMSIWCGVNLEFACFSDSKIQSSLFDTLAQCGSLLSGYNGNVNNCVYALDEDCRTTVWMYQKDVEDGLPDLFQPDQQLRKKKHILYTRRRRDVFKTLGPGSGTELFAVLAFGSLFTAPYRGSELYIDIHEASGDQRIQSLIEKVKFLPFVPEIISAGKKYAFETINAPFMCAQLRLLDGQFKNHWNATFLGLKQKIDSLRQKDAQMIHIFVMTDLPESNWTGSYLGDLARDSDGLKLYILREEEELVKSTAMNLAASSHGLKFGLVPKNFDSKKKHCHPKILSDMLLYIEETVCSCASLGFVGTAGSTIAESIELMMKHGMCVSRSLSRL